MCLNNEVIMIEKVDCNSNDNENLSPSQPSSPQFLIPPLKMGNGDDWKFNITEESRIDRQVLSELPPNTFHYIDQWRKGINLFYTCHAKERMKQYINKCSDGNYDGGYIELYESEAKFLKNPKHLVNHLKNAECVEIGLNKYGKVCKVSFVLDLVEHFPFLYSDRDVTDSMDDVIERFNKFTVKDKSRFLFLCVGVDGGIKTVNITPRRKIKESYGGVVKYLTLNEVIQIIKKYESRSEIRKR